jgi:phosphopantetheine--protein transferase-like protein
MGSVAGRFGNPGQVDYSAANEAMAQVCIARPKSLHIDWTAWADVGMAVRGGMDKLLSDRGVEMLPAHGGSRLVVDMVVNGFSGELMVAGKLGDFGINPTHPLLDAVEMDGDTIVARRDLSLQSDPWIVDHAIDGKPVLPGVIGLELMAATAAMADPGHVYSGATDVEFLAPVKLHGDAVTTVIVRATPADTGVHCTLSSERATRTGRLISTDHFSATICWDMAKQSQLPAMGMPDHPITAEEIYQRFFHGPGFQVLSSASACTADALLADGSVRHTSIAGGLMTDPLVLEAAFQAAGLHRMMVDNVMALPQRIASVSTVRSVRDDESIRLTARRDGNSYDVDVVSDGGLSLALRGFEMVEAGPLPPENTFDPPKGGWTPAVIARVKATGKKGPKAYSTLTEGERSSIAARGTPKRQEDRLLGRLAAKRAVSQLTGLDPLAFEIANHESGEPYVQSANGEAMPRISISHRSGEAVAVATNNGRAGIDLEVVEARDSSFAETWFRPSERQLCSGDPRQESTVWAVKEAVLKALGAGMRLDPREVEVLCIDDGHAEVRLWGEVLSRHAALGAGSLTVDIEDDQAMVIAVAWMAS